MCVWVSFGVVSGHAEACKSGLRDEKVQHCRYRKTFKSTKPPVVNIASSLTCIIRQERCTEISMSVCLYSPTVRISQKPRVQTLLPNLLCVLPVAVVRSSSSGDVVRRVLPVLWMTSRVFLS